MAQSTTTLLQAANDVLLGIGERPITVFGSNLGAKIKSVMTTAFLDVCLLDDWSWLVTRRNADSWLGNKAILNNRRRFYELTYQTAPGQPHTKIPYVFPEKFDNEVITSYSVSGSYPIKYTLDSELHVLMTPYPTTPDEQSKVWFKTAESPQAPIGTTDLFPMPERFVDLVKRRALYLMAIRHLDDMQAASIYQGEYEQMAQRLRDTERRHTVGELNMYGRR